MEIIRIILLSMVIRLGFAQSINPKPTSIPPSLTTPPPVVVTGDPDVARDCNACTIHGGQVQVYWWPTAHDGQQIKTINVDAAGFTFLSPSVYVAFSTLYTANACSKGPTLQITTIAFPQDALSTATGWRWNERKYSARPPRLNSAFILATWGNKVLQTCTYVTSSFLQPLDGPFQNSIYADTAAITSSLGVGAFASTSWSKYTVSYNPCSPTLSAPQQIFTLLPGWSKCERGMEGFFDPPYSLSVGGGLGTVAPPSQPAASSPTGVVIEGWTPAPHIPALITPPASLTTEAPVEELPQIPAPDTSVDQPANTPIANDPGTQPTHAPVEQPYASPTPNPAVNQPGNTPVANSPGPQLGNFPVSPVTNPSTIPTIAVNESPTVSAGGPPTIVSSTAVSLQTDGSNIVVGTTTKPISAIANDLITPNFQVGVVIGTKTVLPGGLGITNVDASGPSNVISISPDASFVVVGSSVIPVSQLGSLKSSDVSTLSAQGFAGLIISIGGFSCLKATPAVQTTKVENEEARNGTTYVMYEGAATSIYENHTWEAFLSLGIAVLMINLCC